MLELPSARLTTTTIHVKTELAATISMLKLNFSPVRDRGSILMQFRLLEPPEFHSTGH